MVAQAQNTAFVPEDPESRLYHTSAHFAAAGFGTRPINLETCLFSSETGAHSCAETAADPVAQFSVQVREWVTGECDRDTLVRWLQKQDTIIGGSADGDRILSAAELLVEVLSNCTDTERMKVRDHVAQLLKEEDLGSIDWLSRNERLARPVEYLQELVLLAARMPHAALFSAPLLEIFCSRESSPSDLFDLGVRRAFSEALIKNQKGEELLPLIWTPAFGGAEFTSVLLDHWGVLDGMLHMPVHRQPGSEGNDEISQYFQNRVLPFLLKEKEMSGAIVDSTTAEIVERVTPHVVQALSLAPSEVELRIFDLVRSLQPEMSIVEKSGEIL